MENTKYRRRREGRWTPIRAKAQDTRANPSSWETHPSEEEVGHWTPTGIEPKDYDDDDDCSPYGVDPCEAKILSIQCRPTVLISRFLYFLQILSICVASK